MALTARVLFLQKKNDLGLTWWAGCEQSCTGFSRQSCMDPESRLVGPFNLAQTCQAHVLGKADLKRFKGTDDAALNNALVMLFKRTAAAIFISDGLNPPDKFREFSRTYDLPIICSELDRDELVAALRSFLTKMLVEATIVHGVFMQIAKVGVLIAGNSGLGKSELALDLVSKGHALIADDAPEFTRITPNAIRGTCPDVLQNFLEVRGLGVLNIREMYGSKAVKPSHRLELIIQLLPAGQVPSTTEDRSQLFEKKTNVLGVDIPTITLPVSPNRNLSVLIEAAARSRSLIQQGYIACRDLSDRQKKLMQ